MSGVLLPLADGRVNPHVADLRSTSTRRTPRGQSSSSPRAFANSPTCTATTVPPGPTPSASAAGPPRPAPPSIAGSSSLAAHSPATKPLTHTWWIAAYCRPVARVECRLPPPPAQLDRHHRGSPLAPPCYSAYRYHRLTVPPAHPPIPRSPHRLRALVSKGVHSHPRAGHVVVLRHDARPPLLGSSAWPLLWRRSKSQLVHRRDQGPRASVTVRRYRWSPRVPEIAALLAVVSRLLEGAAAGFTRGALSFLLLAGVRGTR